MNAKYISDLYKQQKGSLKQKALQVASLLNIEADLMSKGYSKRYHDGALGIANALDRQVYVLNLKTKYDLAVFFHEIAHVIFNHNGNKKEDEIVADKFSDQVIDAIYGGGGYLHVEESEVFFYNQYTNRLNKYN